MNFTKVVIISKSANLPHLELFEIMPTSRFFSIWCPDSGIAGSGFWAPFDHVQTALKFLNDEMGVKTTLRELVEAWTKTDVGAEGILNGVRFSIDLEEVEEEDPAEPPPEKKIKKKRRRKRKKKNGGFFSGLSL